MTKSVTNGAALARARTRLLRSRFAGIAFPKKLGMTLKRITTGEAEVRMPITNSLKQYQGVVHGGAIASLADSAATFAALTVLDDEFDLVTVEFKINFIAGVREGTAIAKGRVVRSGRRISLCEVQVFAPTNRRLVATGTFTMLRFPTSS